MKIFTFILQTLTDPLSKLKFVASLIRLKNKKKKADFSFNIGT